MLNFSFTTYSWLPLICIGGHVASSMIGFLTLPWVMTSELYPLKYRGPLGGLTTSIAQMLTFFTIKLYPDANAAFGLEIIMWIFGISALMGALFAITILPETRGRSLEDIETTFSKNPNTSHFNKTNLSTILSPPKNITLQRFASIPEDKHDTNHVYAYDNFCLDLTLQKDDKDCSKSKFPSNPEKCISIISLEGINL